MHCCIAPHDIDSHFSTKFYIYSCVLQAYFFSVLNLYYKVQFCLSECMCAYLSVLTPLKLLEVQASNLTRLITTPGERQKGVCDV